MFAPPTRSNADRLLTRAALISAAEDAISYLKGSNTHVVAFQFFTSATGGRRYNAQPTPGSGYSFEAVDFGCRPKSNVPMRAIALIKSDSIAGTTISVKIVEQSSPPRTTAPTPR